jgi:tripartite-type tricarboxylate transporter receptor subunit TctC
MERSAIAIVLAAIAAGAHAQAYPSKPIRFIVPVGTPQPVVDRLYRETVKALKMPDVIERLATQGGNELIGSAPGQFAATIRAEIAKYAKIIKDAGIKIE